MVGVAAGVAVQGRGEHARQKQGYDDDDDHGDG